MRKTKLKFTIASLAVHLVVLAVLTATNKLDAATLGIWFGSWNATIAIYASANVAQDSVISRNFHPELVEPK